MLLYDFSEQKFVKIQLGDLMNNNEAVILRAAKMAGIALYGDDLIFRSKVVTFRTVTERVQSLIDNGCDPCCATDIDTSEFAFNLDGDGFDCSDEYLLQEHLIYGGHILLYHPNHGIDFLIIDCGTDELEAIVNQ